MKIIGIAGGSGSGKSTVSYALVDSDPQTFTVLNIDDYHRHREDPNLPMLSGMINWDHPDIMRWDDLISDVRKLKDGQSINIETKASRENPDYALHRMTVRREIKPTDVLIVEGYLALYNSELVKLFDKTFYLDLDPAIRMQRRDKHKLIGETEYNEKILAPMHEKYVEPTKATADVVIDVSSQTVETVCQTIRDNL